MVYTVVCVHVCMCVCVYVCMYVCMLCMKERKAQSTLTVHVQLRSMHVLNVRQTDRQADRQTDTEYTHRARATEVCARAE